MTQLSKSPTGAPLGTKIDRVVAKAVLTRRIQIQLGSKISYLHAKYPTYVQVNILKLEPIFFFI